MVAHNKLETFSDDCTCLKDFEIDDSQQTSDRFGLISWSYSLLCAIILIVRFYVCSWFSSSKILRGTDMLSKKKNTNCGFKVKLPVAQQAYQRNRRLIREEDQRFLGYRPKFFDSL